MHLLYFNDSGGVSLEYFKDSEAPAYAILSHTWLVDGQEVRFHQINGREHLDELGGYKKILFCGKLAKQDGLKYFWVDTCCINKTNTTELQTAINSMFRWYQNAAKCYVYLSDVSAVETTESRPGSLPPWMAEFRDSRWFTRGWTLQELLAPNLVKFYSCEGTFLGDRGSLEQTIHEITGIAIGALRNEPLANFSVDERLSWAKNRQTTLPEDQAYCLLGIFDKFMPYIYGEGQYAWRRLEREIHEDRRPIERERARVEEDRAKFDAILSTLPTSDTAAYNSLESQDSSVCLQDTRVELLQEITRWASMDDDRSLYVLSGSAGTGKSTIARTIARMHDDQHMLGASFFFSKGGGDASHAGMLFTTLASQLASNVEPVRRHICEAIVEHKDITKQTFRDQWEKLIVSPLTRMGEGSGQEYPSTIVLVLDALDECENERDMTNFLKVLAMSKFPTNVRLRIFITSRPQAPIRAGFEQIPKIHRRSFVLHDISSRLIDRDLRLFFRANLTEIAIKRDLPSGWPGERDTERLVARSCGLFIWASTACLYIGKKRRTATQQLKTLVQGQSHATGGDPQKHLDQIYTTVVMEAIKDADDDDDEDEEGKEELYSRMREILGTIIVLFSPLSISSLAELLDIPAETVMETLADLHAILNVPSNEERHRPIRLHHPSFRDFLLDRSRSSGLDFWIDEKDAHKLVADKCVAVMAKRLRQNMCNLTSPGTTMAAIGSNRVQRHLPPELQYACLHWAQHYRQGDTYLRDGDVRHKFFQAHFLHWVEAVSLIGKSSELAPIMRMYQSLLVPADNSKQVPFVKDMRKFIVNYQSKVEQSQAPLQIYCAALASMTPSNQVRHHFWRQIHPFLDYVNVIKADAREAKDDYNYVCAVAFTPDGKFLASGSLEEWVRVWDTSTMATVGKYEGQTDKTSAVDISADGSMLASGSDDFTVMVWDMPARTTRHIWTGHRRWVNAVAFSPTTSWLASASSDETVKLWDLSTGQELNTIQPNLNSINSVAFSPDGTRIALATSDHVIQLWDPDPRKPGGVLLQPLEGHTGPVYSVQYSPNGTHIVSGSDDTTVRLWEADTGLPVRTVGRHLTKVWAVAFARDGSRIASGSEDKTIKIWASLSGNLLFTLKGHTSGINSVVFSPDSRRLASGSFNDDVRLWDLDKQECLGSFADFEETVPDADPADLDGSHPSVFGSPTSRSRAHSQPVSCLCFSPNGQLVASGSHDTLIKIWTNEGAEYRCLRGHTQGVTQLAFSPSGKMLASTSSDRTIRLWNPTLGAAICAMDDQGSCVRTLRFSPDEKLLATSSQDGNIKIWDTGKATMLGELRYHYGAVYDIAFSPNGDFVATCAEDTAICLWDVKSGILKLHMAKAHAGSINSITFSSDSQRLVSCSSDGTVKCWESAKMVCHTEKDYEQPVIHAEISADCQRIVSSLQDGSVKVWSLMMDTDKDVAKFDIALRRDSFSGARQFVETEGPPLQADESAIGVSIIGHTLFVDGDWVKRDQERVLWLTEDYKPVSFATWRNMGVLGHKSGAISFIRV